MSLLKDISTAFWFAAHPTLYPQLGRSLRRRLRPSARPADEAAQAQRWCAERAVSTAVAIGRLTGAPMPEPVRQRHEDTFESADEAAAPYAADFGGAGDLDLIYWLCEYVEARRVIETGVAMGWSSLAILLSIVQRDGELVSTNMPYPFGDRRGIGVVVPAWMGAQWTLIPLPDGEAVPRALAKLPEIDLAHYDSDKTYEGRMLTYPRLWGALRPGGVFVSADIGDDLAFREFAERCGVEPMVVQPGTGDKYVGVMVKA